MKKLDKVSNRREFFAMIIALMGILATTTGCGSSGGTKAPDPTGSEVTRALLDGGGTTSGAGVTQKNWRVVAVAGNQNYPSSGADQTCPVVLNSLVDENETLECGANDTVTIRSDGTFKFQGFGKTWSLSGSKVTLDYGAAIGTQVIDITPQTVGGVQRIRLLQISLTRNGALQPHDDGAVIVLEEERP
jgi:hypothetical protein